VKGQASPAGDCDRWQVFPEDEPLTVGNTSCVKMSDDPEDKSIGVPPRRLLRSGHWLAPATLADQADELGKAVRSILFRSRGISLSFR
jgi:hypothetical protein